MTKRIFDAEKLQRKNVNKISQMIKQGALKGKYGDNFKHQMDLDELMGICKYYNLVTVKQIMKAIR